MTPKDSLHKSQCVLDRVSDELFINLAKLLLIQEGKPVEASRVTSVREAERVIAVRSAS